MLWPLCMCSEAAALGRPVPGTSPKRTARMWTLYLLPGIPCLQALASLALLIDLPDKPAVSALGFLWLDSALTALQRHFWHALHADPAQPEAAGACTLAMLQGLVPLLLYKLGDMFMNKQRVVWAAKMLR